MEPQDYPDKRDALIGEFQNYLGILKVRSQGSHSIGHSSSVSFWCASAARGLAVMPFFEPLH